MSWEEWSEVRAEEREMRAEEEEIMAEARIGEMEMLEEIQMDAEMRQALYGQKTITGAATGLGARGGSRLKSDRGSNTRKARGSGGMPPPKILEI